MLRTLDRYVAKEVIKGALIAVTVLLALLNFFTFADELGDLGEGDYGMRQIFGYLALTSPRAFYELMPSAALVGGLVTLGGLANNRELMAMQAAGASRARIIRAVLMGGLVLLALSVAVGELVAPGAEREANALKSTALKKQVASRTKYGFWVRDGNIFINIRRVDQPENLGDINIYEVSPDKRLLLASHANKAIYDGSQWGLVKIRASYFQPGEVTADLKPTMDWSSVLAPDLLNAFVIRPENLSAWELDRYIDYLRENGQNPLPVEQAFWGRIVQPAVTLVMLLVAVPFVLTIKREVGMGQRIVVGVVIGLGFYLFDRMFSHFGLIYEMNPIFAASFPTALAFLGAMIGLMRMRAG
ncbi:LPS export ABC transporter permease LptG [Methylomagnum ishizawai]|uniref:LPS export ABC transporter permease LptG n=1 Tax=Methylomagnum ishizawai TaxID=1760988 RepID=UPI001C325010|nr:LPS export ABC transporter permease LptG [Methylomagnum ishizawai]BBL75855.1 LPS export ABC transporter permease LptG [Methylomagnum ishizawai]